MSDGESIIFEYSYWGTVTTKQLCYALSNGNAYKSGVQHVIYIIKLYNINEKIKQFFLESTFKNANFKTNKRE